jgi:hypothetical protein
VFLWHRPSWATPLAPTFRPIEMRVSHGALSIDDLRDAHKKALRTRLRHAAPSEQQVDFRDNAESCGDHAQSADL